MANEILDFDEKRDCPACLEISDNVEMEYVEKRQILNIDKQEYLSDGYIEKTCKRCRYKWIEHPAFKAS
jgi:hypothetical protein